MGFTPKLLGYAGIPADFPFSQFLDFRAFHPHQPAKIFPSDQCSTPKLSSLAARNSDNGL